MSEIAAIVSELQQAYCRAVYNKDVEAFLPLYDPDVRLFDAWGVWQYEGATTWRNAVESWFSSLGDECVEVTFEDTRADGTPEYGLASATVTYAAVSITGEKLRCMQNRLTWGLRQHGQAAVILHKHTSAPIGEGNTAKAALDSGPRRHGPCGECGGAWSGPSRAAINVGAMNFHVAHRTGKRAKTVGAIELVRVAGDKRQAAQPGKIWVDKSKPSST